MSLKRFLTPERLINDSRVDAKMLGMYVTFMANTQDGKHVIKSSDDLRSQMKMSNKTYFKYRNDLAKLGYISFSHNDFMMPSLITLKDDNANFIETNFDDFQRAQILAEDDNAEPLEVFRSLYAIDIPTVDLKRIEQLNIPNHVMALALRNVYEHEEDFNETNYSKMLNYAIKVAIDYKDHDVSDEDDIEAHYHDYLKERYGND